MEVTTDEATESKSSLAHDAPSYNQQSAPEPRPSDREKGNTQVEGNMAGGGVVTHEAKNISVKNYFYGNSTTPDENPDESKFVDKLKEQVNEIQVTTQSDPTEAFHFSEQERQNILFPEHLSDKLIEITHESLTAIACDKLSFAHNGLWQLCQAKQHKPKHLRRYNAFSQKKLSQKLTFDSFFRCIDTIETGSLIIIDLISEISEQIALHFLINFLSEESPIAYTENIKRGLDRNSLSVVLILPEGLIKHKPQLRQYFHVVDLEAIKFIYYQHADNPSESEYQQLLAQIDSNLWSTRPLHEIETALKNKTFDQKFIKYHLSEASAFLQDKQYFDKLLDPLKYIFAPVCETLLTTIMFFPKLSEVHFEHVFLFLLSDQAIIDNDMMQREITHNDTSMTTPEAPHSQQNTPSPFHVHVHLDSHNGPATNNPKALENEPTKHHKISHADASTATRSTSFAFTHSLKPFNTWNEFWNQGGKKHIIKLCKIKTIQGDNNDNYIGFLEPHFYRAAKDALVSADPFYFTAYFYRMLDLVFDPHEAISKAATNFVIEQMKRQSNCNAHWLYEWFSMGLEHNGYRVQAVCKRDDNNDSAFESLLDKMFSHNHLKTIARGFLDELMYHEQYQYLLNFVNALHDTLGPDALHWFNRIFLTTDDPSVLNDGLVHLVSLMQSKAYINSLWLISLADWLQDLSSDQRKLSCSESYALLVPLFMLNSSVHPHSPGSTSVKKPHWFPITGTIDRPYLVESTSVFMRLLLHPMQYKQRGMFYPVNENMLASMLGSLRFSSFSIRTMLPEHLKHLRFIADPTATLPEHGYNEIYIQRIDALQFKIRIFFFSDQTITLEKITTATLNDHLEQIFSQQSLFRRERDLLIDSILQSSNITVSAYELLILGQRNAADIAVALALCGWASSLESPLARGQAPSRIQHRISGAHMPFRPSSSPRATPHTGQPSTESSSNLLSTLIEHVITGLPNERIKNIRSFLMDCRQRLMDDRLDIREASGASRRTLSRDAQQQKSKFCNTARKVCNLIYSAQRARQSSH